MLALVGGAADEGRTARAGGNLVAHGLSSLGAGRLTYTSILALIVAPGLVVTVLLVDVIGRRKLFMMGLFRLSEQLSPSLPPRGETLATAQQADGDD
jgi:hypothetical protein